MQARKRDADRRGKRVHVVLQPMGGWHFSQDQSRVVNNAEKETLIERGVDRAGAHSGVPT